MYVKKIEAKIRKAAKERKEQAGTQQARKDDQGEKREKYVTRKAAQQGFAHFNSWPTAKADYHGNKRDGSTPTPLAFSKIHHARTNLDGRWRWAPTGNQFLDGEGCIEASREQTIFNATFSSFQLPVCILGMHTYRVLSIFNVIFPGTRVGPNVLLTARL